MSAAQEKNPISNRQSLPPIPGGWTQTIVRIADRSFQLTLPRKPDAFLDDPDVLAESRRDDYMPYWPYLWPAAESMARLVLQAEWPSGTEALEVGCGIGLVGLSGLARGLEVTFSDYRLTAVDLAIHNARQNGFADVCGMLLDWRRPVAGRFPVILASDVLYETGNHGPVLDLLETMLADDGVCWIGDPGRQHAAEFVGQAKQRGFVVQLRDEDGAALGEPQIGRFQLLVLTRAEPRQGPGNSA